MVNYYVFTLASLAAALPLNINLGAYSPALVVGDGEVSVAQHPLQGNPESLGLRPLA